MTLVLEREKLPIQKFVSIGLVTSSAISWLFALYLGIVYESSRISRYATLTQYDNWISIHQTYPSQIEIDFSVGMILVLLSIASTRTGELKTFLHAQFHYFAFGAKAVSIIASGFFWIFALTEWFGLAYGISSLSLGYYAMISFGTFCLAFLSLNLLKISCPNKQNLAKAFFRAVGPVALTVLIFELGIFVTQTWSCFTPQNFADQHLVNLFQWISNGYKVNPSWGCEWTMNFAVTQYSWEFLGMGWLKNWSFGTIGAVLFSLYTFAKLRRLI